MKIASRARFLVYSCGVLLLLGAVYLLSRSSPDAGPRKGKDQHPNPRVAKGTVKGDLVMRLPLGPITQQDFNDVLDSGQITRIVIGADMVNDAGTGTLGIGIVVHSAPDYPLWGAYLGDYLDMADIDNPTYAHYFDYYYTPAYHDDFVALLNLMREKNFFNLNVTRDPNGGPNRYDIGVTIGGYGANGEDWKYKDITTNVRDTSNPDNAAFFQILDFIRGHFVNYGLANWDCRLEYQNGDLVSQTGPGCVPAS